MSCRPLNLISSITLEPNIGLAHPTSSVLGSNLIFVVAVGTGVAEMDLIGVDSGIAMESSVCCAKFSCSLPFSFCESLTVEAVTTGVGVLTSMSS